MGRVARVGRVRFVDCFEMFRECVSSLMGNLFNMSGNDHESAAFSVKLS